MEDGQWRRAMAMEIRDVRAVAQAIHGDARTYNEAIREMLDYAYKIGML